MKEINKDWLIEKMAFYGFTNRELSKRLNISEHQVSRWINGHVELGKLAKNHLYHFFRCLELENELKTLKNT